MPDLVKEAVFNLLRGHCEDGPVLDLFCGTGTMGLECVSRGSPRVVFVERDRRVVQVLEKNIETLGVQDECEVVAGDALGPAALTRCPRPAHLIFVDPPYDLVNEPDGWQRVVRQCSRLVELLDDTGYLVLRTPWPFLHAAEDDAHAPAATLTLDLSDEEADAALDAFEAELEAAAARAREAGELKPPGAPRTVDLTIEGADGPETHEYGTTAVHLYVKHRG
jgi:16S rRNA G966 N2-methylase RsmD